MKLEKKIIVNIFYFFEINISIFLNNQTIQILFTELLHILPAFQ